MQKKLVQSSLALSAAAALGLGGALTASPAMADNGPQKLDVQSEAQVQKALSDVDGVNAYGAKDGKLNLGVEKKTSEIKDLEKKYKNITITEGVKELKAYAGNDVVGGAGYTVGSESEVSGVCTTGFSGWDGDGKPVVLTAGHCSKLMDEDSGKITGDSTVNDTEKPSTAPANGSEKSELSGNGVLGKWGFHSFGDSGQHDETEDPNNAKDSDIDFAVINVDESKYGVKNGVTDWKKADSDDLSSSLATEITKVGAHKDGKIQKSGRTTGLTEGEVFSEYNEKFDFANISGYWVHGFGVTSSQEKPFSQPGDSGGAVFQDDTAVGVISGGGPMDDGTQFGWVADLDHSLEESGVDFSLKDPADETPEAPKAPEAKDQTIEPKGDVKGKAKAGAEVKVEWDAAKGAQAAKDGSETVKADKDGNFTIEGPEAEGDYDYSATAVVDGQESESTDFTVTVKKDESETPAPVEREITVDPKEIAASDFVKEDKGVTVSVKGFDEGEKVTLKVASGPENVKGITLDETANKDGVAAFSIYGTSASDPSVYLGKYDVQVTGANDTDDEKALAGSFNVVEDEDGNGGGNGGDDDGNDDGNGNGGDDDGNGDGGSDLPRTGAELTGLAAGAGLLVVGGTAVVLTLRRNKKN
ncbi:LPXTG cell wall anchor domain-containing protein [Brevibacterium aurantiacum]|uniref:LPXTG cell wall anchor domain-containing protein n=1 Tax=Brevibacterium aurantiacum TaxID=273384 RepID=A0A4Z0KK31_BREAU|nr:LPXTG cell wall anchor domain-containing protein [Brevibacterium aurantiacum]TGD39088.1 LPXTG cell wall anchor domain-containing protein [Brevibacterium aurantiacum]